jgi:ubiquinone/menaquinone biosynthesis C-methylase UbiE
VSGVPTPPRELWPQSGDFAESGQQSVQFLVESVGLRPDDAILDVGCGPGRLALALKGFLNAGHYEGFDVRADAVRWADDHIRRGDPHYTFRHVDVVNRAYQPAASVPASEFRFPYQDDSFTVGVLFSVFTHLVAEDTRAYLSEITRVLRTTGRVVATFFLLEGPGTVQTPNRTLEFVHNFDRYRAIARDIPEQAVAYSETDVRDFCREAGLELHEPIM